LFCAKFETNLTKDALEKVSDIFEMAEEKMTDSYGNARVNMVEFKIHHS